MKWEKSLLVRVGDKLQKKWSPEWLDSRMYRKPSLQKNYTISFFKNIHICQSHSNCRHEHLPRLPQERRINFTKVVERAKSKMSPRNWKGEGYPIYGTQPPNEASPVTTTPSLQAQPRDCAVWKGATCVPQDSVHKTVSKSCTMEWPGDSPMGTWPLHNLWTSLHVKLFQSK